jgi:hypothetical protein
MTTENISAILTQSKLAEIFPSERSNEFFDALFGDASEGSFDIELAYRGATETQLVMELRLHERPNCCLACNLTQGLPQVFSRHPVINVDGVVQEIDTLLGDAYTCRDWTLGYTEQKSNSLHVIPVKITLEKK